ARDGRGARRGRAVTNCDARAAVRALGYAAIFDDQDSLAAISDGEPADAEQIGRIAGAVGAGNDDRADPGGRIAEGGAEGAGHLDHAAILYRQYARSLIA